MPGSDFLQLRPPATRRTAWLVDEIRGAVATGLLGEGAGLPPTRVLAADLGVARGTVVEAYRRLRDEGLVDTAPGGGTFVRRVPVSPPASRAPGPGLLRISTGLPDLAAFPRTAWVEAERRVLATADLGYADPRGVPALRQALSGWLARSRGIRAHPDDILVTAGVTGALSLLAQEMTDRGLSSCALEDPGAEGNRRILSDWLPHTPPVRVDEEGLRVSDLTLTEARAVLVTPAHQFPLGVRLSEERRTALLEWARRVDGLVIEDDYDAEYRYDRFPERPLLTQDAERVAYVSSLSKIVSPALRLGWLIAPAGWREALAHRRWATDLGSSALTQEVLAELISSGRLERHVRTLRARHRRRRDAAVRAIAAHLPGCRVEGVAAGLHLVVHLPEGVDDAALAAGARERGIDVAPLSRHRHAPGRAGLVVGYGPHPPARLAGALALIGDLLPRG